MSRGICQRSALLGLLAACRTDTHLAAQSERSHRAHLVRLTVQLAGFTLKWNCLPSAEDKLV